MKTEFNLTLFNDEYVKSKLAVMNCMEAMFDDERNPLPDQYFLFSDALPLGTTIRVTLEVVPNADMPDATL